MSAFNFDEANNNVPLVFFNCHFHLLDELSEEEVSLYLDQVIRDDLASDNEPRVDKGAAKLLFPVNFPLAKIHQALLSLLQIESFLIESGIDRIRFERAGHRSFGEPYLRLSLSLPDHKGSEVPLDVFSLGWLDHFDPLFQIDGLLPLEHLRVCLAADGHIRFLGWLRDANQ
jgi:hypothetical protein